MSDRLCPVPDQRPHRGCWVPGNYFSRCVECRTPFIGDKYALMCADCAYAKPKPLAAKEANEQRCRSLTLVHLRKHPEKRHRFKQVRIWSGEHLAWWRPNSRGYTDDINQAGVYTMDEAWATSSHCCKKKKIVYQEVNP